MIDLSDIASLRCDRLILTAGSPRSGSTWLYNAVRLICEQAGGRTLGGWIGDLDVVGRSGACDDLVIKIHNADPKLARRANFVFSSHRDLRDIGASIREMGWAKSDNGVMRQVAKVRRAHAFWSAEADLDVAYDAILKRPQKILRRLADILRVPVDDEALERINVELKGLSAESGRMTAQHDAVNLMHDGHRKDGRAGSWRERMTEELAARIVAEHGDWLRTYGYLDEPAGKPKPARKTKERASRKG